MDTSHTFITFLHFCHIFGNLCHILKIISAKFFFRSKLLKKYTWENIAWLGAVRPNNFYKLELIFSWFRLESDNWMYTSVPNRHRHCLACVLAISPEEASTAERSHGCEANVDIRSQYSKLMLKPEYLVHCDLFN